MSDLVFTSDQANTAEVRAAKVRGWLLAVLIIVPAVIMIGKHPALPTSAEFGAWFNLGDLPQHVKPHVEYMLFVPLSAIVVSFFRLTLGMPVLSLFRPILVAIAFRVMGIPMGLAFLIFVLGSAIMIRPLLKDLHYYARVPVLLSIASTFMVVPLVFTRWWHEMWLQHLAYFPLISLALICEAFVRTLDEKGLAEAAWPTVNTILVGTVITVIAKFHGVLHLLVYYPELLIMQIGMVLFIAEYMHFEWLQDKNPFLLKNPGTLGESQQISAAGLIIDQTTSLQTDMKGGLA